MMSVVPSGMAWRMLLHYGDRCDSYCSLVSLYRRAARRAFSERNLPDGAYNKQMYVCRLLHIGRIRHGH
jgi:hypothetical protein